MKREDLESRILELLDGNASVERAAELEQILRSDPQARSVYRTLSRLHSALGARYEGKAEVETIFPARFQRSTPSTSRWLLGGSIAAAAVLMIAFLMFRKGPAVSDAVAYRLSPGAVCEVSYANGSKASHGDNLSNGAQVNLLGGSFECSLRNGAHLVIEGPAEFYLQDQNHLVLERGVGWFQIPQTAKGFSVSTNELEVIDQGSEFGVLSLSKGPDQVHVLSGKVALTTRIGSRTSEVLTAGQVRVVNHDGTLLPLPPNPGRFRSTLPGEMPYLYFNFDKVDRTGKIQVEGNLPGANVIQAHLIGDDPTSRLVPGAVGNAISFGEGEGAWIDTNWSGFNGNTPRSAAFWFKFEKDAQKTGLVPAAIAWGDPDNHFNRKWKVWFPRDSGDGELHACISFGGDRFYDSHVLDDGHWHHLAAIYTGKTHEDGLPDCSLYLDGELCKLEHQFGAGGKPYTNTVDTLTGGPGDGPLRMGYGITPDLPKFEGMLDEIYIYQGVIDEKIINSLRAAGPPVGGD
ncbi:hypothetical protein JIN85_02720 [Luteolibacter pohnpeiensis]|uniref:LamG-like jellyroll fold domain-containing protein n=1 Tax=Luteolibacter pohnpeiensis TaxID=454153 RepID=A0A934S4X9_9BACT|nr:LamG-like jellyroll fold domain-containing protein [Luteolibacter pohnpeiensis]MBK1881310.1 hypothetical protein [Luteolibacter pohnpeiensis]